MLRSRAERVDPEVTLESTDGRTSVVGKPIVMVTGDELDVTEMAARSDMTTWIHGTGSHVCGTCKLATQALPSSPWGVVVMAGGDVWPSTGAIPT